MAQISLAYVALETVIANGFPHENTVRNINYYMYMCLLINYPLADKHRYTYICIWKCMHMYVGNIVRECIVLCGVQIKGTIVHVITEHVLYHTCCNALDRTPNSSNS